MSLYGRYNYSQTVRSPPAVSSYTPRAESSSSSSYRSPYSENSYGSNYTVPTYEPKFDSLISRNVDGVARSRAGTSTRYDYLSNYTSSKYDFPRTSAGKSSLMDADDLTKSYFEKYYSKKTSNTADTTPTSPVSKRRSSRAYSIYLDDEKPGLSRTSRSSVAPEENFKIAASLLGIRTSSVAPETYNSRSSVARDTDYTSRYRAQSLLKDEKAESKYDDKSSTRRDSISGDSIHSLTSKYRTFSPSDSTRKSDNVPPTCRSAGMGVNHGNDTSNSGTNDTSNLTYRLRRLSINDDNDRSSSISASKDTDDSYSSTLTRRGSTRAYGGESEGSTKAHGGDSDPRFSTTTRTYGERSRLTSESDKSNGPTYSRFQTHNGYSEDDGPSTNNSCDSNHSSSQTGYNGLRNIGNTCFMNSVLQCLSNTKPLLQYITQDEYTRDINTSNSSMKGALVKAFANVIKNLWKGSQRTAVDPSSFKGAMQRYAPRFSGYNQEDCQEFLRYLLEGLHEDVNRVTTKPVPINSEIDSSLSVCEQAMEAWKRYIRRDDSQLVDQFVGQLKSTLRCSQCGYESVTFEAFWDLSLPIPGRTDCSLQDCFDAFTREEILDGDEMPTCERCKTRRKCTKWYRVYKFPKILVIHLKRFSPNERHRSKLSALVDFPLQNLDLGSYTDSATRSTFNCYGVSNHSGTLYSGHYTATARHPYNGNWSTFSDSSVSKLTSSSSVISKEAYLLFFELL